jgi:iron(III) transport system ATP-binding protein
MKTMVQIAPATTIDATQPALALRGVSKTYAGVTPAVAGLSLEAQPNEVLALLGPSGCGKTTALRLIAGLERPDEGEIEVAGKPVTGRNWLPPHKRSVGMVFQDYALFPHLTVAGNVGYGLNTLDRAQRRERIGQVLQMTGLDGYAKRHPHELSGGQQQRVAIARAIAPRPAVVLLDEPFSNLDVEMREQVRSEVLALLRAAGVTVMLVTHDQDEAFVVADRIAVMSDGRLHQTGTAEDLYYRPQTRFVAQFVGIANFLKNRADGNRAHTVLGAFDVAGEGDVLLRPEQIEVARDGLAVRVVGREFHGHDWLYVLRTADGEELRIIGNANAPIALGAEVRVRAVVDRAPAFPAN